MFAQPCFCVLVGGLQWWHLVLPPGTSRTLLLLLCPSCLLWHARSKTGGMQYVFSVLIGIYAHFTGIVLGCNELAGLIDFDPPDGGQLHFCEVLFLNLATLLLNCLAYLTV